MLLLQPPLEPKRGRVLKVILITRVSRIDPERGDSRSNQAQRELLEQWLRGHYPGKAETLWLADVGSGERLDREQLLKAQELVASGEYDLVLAEDLGRIMRRNAALFFCEEAEDSETRVVAINDSIDTAQEGWRLNACFAAMRHELYNKDTACRIRRQQRSNFENGGLIKFFLPGYNKPPGAKLDGEVTIDPKATKVYDEWFDKLERGWTFGRVSDWLNEIKFPVGPCCKTSKRWTGSLVGSVTRNPLLKGLRRHNVRQSKRVNSTGKAKSVRSPEEFVLTRECPHLAHIEPERYDRVISILKRRNSNYRRGKETGIDPRVGVPKKRTTWPGQHLTCGVCGRSLIYSCGQGQKQLTCSGAVGYRCWNSVSLNAPKAGKKIAAAILGEIESWPDYDQELRSAVNSELSASKDKRSLKCKELTASLKQLEREEENVCRAIRQEENSKSLVLELNKIEREKEDITYELSIIKDEKDATPDLPDIETIRQIARESLEDIAPDSPDFACWIKRLVPTIHVFPIRLIDGGKIRFRARVGVNLQALNGNPGQSSSALDHLRKDIMVDLFDLTQRERLLDEIWRLSQRTAPKLKERDIASRLGVTQPVVQRAKKLYRLMIDQGREEPYVFLFSPPTEPSTLRRHLHKRYQFEPLEGYPVAPQTD